MRQPNGRGEQVSSNAVPREAAQLDGAGAVANSAPDYGERMQKRERWLRNMMVEGRYPGGYDTSP